MWDSYEKQHGPLTSGLPTRISPLFVFVEMDEARKREEFSQSQQNNDMQHGSFFDPVQTITDEHKHNFGYYRMHPNRQILVPHKISLGDVFGDQSHMTVDRRSSHRPTSNMNSSMQLSDLNQNRRKLREVESMQLLSSLVIRSIQVHRKHVPFIPGSMVNNMDSASSFADALAISQMHLHSSSFNGFPQPSFQSANRLPPIIRRRPSSAQAARDRSDATTRVARAGLKQLFRILPSTPVDILGVNIRKAQDMEDLLSHLLKPDEGQFRSTLAPHSTPHPAPTPEDTYEHEITHARLLENCKRFIRFEGTASKLMPFSAPSSRQIESAQSNPTDPSSLSEICTSIEFESANQPGFSYFQRSRCQTTRFHHWQRSGKRCFQCCWRHHHSLDELMYSRTSRHYLPRKNQSNAGKSPKGLLEKRVTAVWFFSHTKPSIPPFDDEHSSNFFDYSAPIHLTAMQQQQREEHQKRNLPPVRGLKASVLLCSAWSSLILSTLARRAPLPRHVLKFSFREIELDSAEASIESLRDENVSKSRRRRIYMHLMVSVWGGWTDLPWLSPPPLQCNHDRTFPHHK